VIRDANFEEDDNLLYLNNTCRGDKKNVFNYQYFGVRLDASSKRGKRTWWLKKYKNRSQVPKEIKEHGDKKMLN
jgi:hypothetical protein